MTDGSACGLCGVVPHLDKKASESQYQSQIAYRKSAKRILAVAPVFRDADSDFHVFL